MGRFIASQSFRSQIAAYATSETLGGFLGPQETRRAAAAYFDPDSAIEERRDSSWAPPNILTPVVGNGMRLDSTPEIRLDERWKSALTKDDLAVFNRVAGAMNRRCGYQ